MKRVTMVLPDGFGDDLPSVIFAEAAIAPAVARMLRAVPQASAMLEDVARSRGTASSASRPDLGSLTYTAPRLSEKLDG